MHRPGPEPGPAAPGPGRGLPGRRGTHVVQRQLQLVQLQLQPGLRGRRRRCHDGEPQQRDAADPGGLAGAAPAPAPVRGRPQPDEHGQLANDLAGALVAVAAPAALAAGPELRAHRVQPGDAGHARAPRHGQRPRPGRPQRPRQRGHPGAVAGLQHGGRQAPEAAAADGQRRPRGQRPRPPPRAADPRARAVREEVRAQQQQVPGHLRRHRREVVPEAGVLVLLPHRHGPQEQQERQPARVRHLQLHV